MKLLNKTGIRWLIVLAVLALFFASGIWCLLQGEGPEDAFFSFSAADRWLILCVTPFSLLFGFFACKMTGQAVLPPAIYATAWFAFQLPVELIDGLPLTGALRTSLLLSALFGTLCLAVSGFTKWFSLHKKGLWLLAMMAGYLLLILTPILTFPLSRTSLWLLVILPAAVFHAMYGIVAYKLVRRILFPTLLLLTVDVPLWMWLGWRWSPVFCAGVALCAIVPIAAWITRRIARKAEPLEVDLPPETAAPAEKRPITPKAIRSFIFWLLLMAIPAIARLCELIPNWFYAGWYFPNDGNYVQLILYALSSPIRYYLSLIGAGALAIMTISRPRLSAAPRAHRVLKWVASVAIGLDALLAVVTFVVTSHDGIFAPGSWFLQSVALVRVALSITALFLPNKHRRAAGILAIVCAVLSFVGAASSNLLVFPEVNTPDAASARYLINTLLAGYHSGCITLFALYPLKPKTE